VRKVVGRTELIETPVAGDEVFGVLKRRLFQSVGDERAAKEAVSAFQEYYGEYPRFFPERLRSQEYRERMLAAYPFHPELVDLLYQRWGPHPDFQRTRGALRLMALVLRRLWEQRPGSAYLIQPHHIDLADRHIRAEVVKLLDGSFEGIVTGDILDRAKGIDRELGGEYSQERLAEGAAGVALLYSISGGTERQGCTEEELRVALLRPEINPAQVTEALERLRQRLWYLRYRDRYYFFTAKPNLNKLILDFEQGIPDERVEECVKEFLRKLAGTGGELQPYLAPDDPSMVNEPSRATLVILPLSLGGFDEMHDWMKKVVSRVTARNLLVFLVPDTAKEGALRVAVRRYLALEDLRKSRRFSEMDKEDQSEVGRQIKDKESEIQGLLLGMYTKVFRPAADGVREEQVVLKRDGKTLVEIVATALKEKGILVESVSPEWIKDAFQIGQQPVSLSQMKTTLEGSPDYPIVPNPQQALINAVREGVERGEFAVKVGDRVFTEIPEGVAIDSGTLIVPIETPPPPPPTPRAGLILEATSSGRNLYPLGQVLQKLQGKDVEVTLIVRDEKGELAEKRSELEQLLNDYSIPHEFKKIEQAEGH